MATRNNNQVAVLQAQLEAERAKREAAELRAKLAEITVTSSTTTMDQAPATEPTKANFEFGQIDWSTAQLKCELHAAGVNLVQMMLATCWPPTQYPDASGALRPFQGAIEMKLEGRWDKRSPTVQQLPSGDKVVKMGMVYSFGPQDARQSEFVVLEFWNEEEGARMRKMMAGQTFGHRISVVGRPSVHMMPARDDLPARPQLVLRPRAFRIGEGAKAQTVTLGYPSFEAPPVPAAPHSDSDGPLADIPVENVTAHAEDDASDIPFSDAIPF